MDINGFLTYFIGELNRQYEHNLDGLSEEQLYFLPSADSCHIAFHAWHFARTEDNVLNFICQDRKSTVWVRQGLHERWGLPKVTQGTGMPLAEAQALRVPGADSLIKYIRDTWADVEPYLAGASMEELQGIANIRLFGDRPKLHHIGHTIMAHGNEHLGQINVLRTLQGLQGVAFLLQLCRGRFAPPL
ncbi:MAG: DinB family protein, partial [Chloroflexi bacterium]|nr:DinB family protein [Chloroflexota bacterium]